MGSPISRRPAGLLDLLLTQQQGQHPGELLNSVAGVLDLAKFYMPDRLSIAVNSHTFSAVGAASTRTIPAGEVWLILGFGGRVPFATLNQHVRTGFSIDNVPLGANPHRCESKYFAPLNGATDVDSHSFNDVPIGYLYPSGTVFTWSVESLNLDGQPNLSASWTAHYVKLVT